MKSKAVLSSIVIIGLAIGAQNVKAGAYSFFDLGTLGGFGSEATAINNAGQVVGWAHTPSNPQNFFGYQHATLWVGNIATDLGTLGGSYSSAKGINNLGQIVGYSQTEGLAQRATLWNGSDVIDLGSLGGSISNAMAINDAGQVAGNSYFGTNKTPHVVVWNGVTGNDLTAMSGKVGTSYGINNVGKIVGTNLIASPNGNGTYTMSNLGSGASGGNYSEARDINDIGQIVGWSYATGNIRQRATLWDGSMAIELSNLAGIKNSDAEAINSSGQIVGKTELQVSGFSSYHATMWTGSSVIDLNDYLDPTTVRNGWELITANDINDNGWIVGGARNKYTGEMHAYLLSAIFIPEPGTFALLAFALAGLAASRRKRIASI